MEEEHLATDGEGIVVVFLVMGLGWGGRAWEDIKEELTIGVEDVMEELEAGLGDIAEELAAGLDDIIGEGIVVEGAVTEF